MRVRALEEVSRAALDGIPVGSDRHGEGRRAEADRSRRRRDKGDGGADAAAGAGGAGADGGGPTGAGVRRGVHGGDFGGSNSHHDHDDGSPRPSRNRRRDRDRSRRDRRRHRSAGRATSGEGNDPGTASPFGPDGPVFSKKMQNQIESLSSRESLDFSSIKGQLRAAAAAAAANAKSGSIEDLRRCSVRSSSAGSGPCPASDEGGSDGGATGSSSSPSPAGARAKPARRRSAPDSAKKNGPSHRSWSSGSLEGGGEIQDGLRARSSSSDGQSSTSLARSYNKAAAELQQANLDLESKLLQTQKQLKTFTETIKEKDTLLLRIGECEEEAALARARETAALQTLLEAKVGDRCRRCWTLLRCRRCWRRR